jgi:hypothetical protein
VGRLMKKKIQSDFKEETAPQVAKGKVKEGGVTGGESDVRQEAVTRGP